MAHVPLKLLPHRVTVERYTGQTGSGADAFVGRLQIRAFVRDEVQLIDGPDGTQKSSSAWFGCRLSDGRRISTGDRVTLPSGRACTVASIKNADDDGLGAWQHSQVFLK